MRSSICSLTNENRRPRIAAHILPLSATLALSHGSLTSTKYPRLRGIESVRQNVGFALYRPNETVYIRQANKTVCRRPNETVYIRQANKTVCRYCLQADYGFDSLDKIPTLTRYRKRKAKRRVRSIPTKRNGIYHRYNRLSVLSSSG